MAYRKAYRSESTRCPGWDYASPGVYFVTICTQQHRCYFGEVKNGRVVLNPLGAIVNHLKGACTRRIRSEYQPSFAWQPRYYDHIIRGERDLENLRWYITLNPENWRDSAQCVYDEVLSHA